MRLLAAGIAASINCCLLPAGTASPVPPPGEDHSLTSGGGSPCRHCVCWWGNREVCTVYGLPKKESLAIVLSVFVRVDVGIDCVVCRYRCWLVFNFLIMFNVERMVVSVCMYVLGLWVLGGYIFINHIKHAFSYFKPFSPHSIISYFIN